MDFAINIFGYIYFVAFLGMVIIFLLTSLRETNYQAAIRGFLLFTPIIILFSILILLNFFAKHWVISGILFFSGAIIFIVILIVKHNQSIRIVSKQERIDERDAFFHRFYRIQPDTPEFKNFYRHHPEKFEVDEKIRALPSLGEPGSNTYHPKIAPFSIAAFSVLEGMTREIDWKSAPIEGMPVSITPQEATCRIKGFARYVGADLVGTTKLNPAYVYSHIGRSPGRWGAPIHLHHEYAIAIAVEMPHDMIRHAPDSPTITETAVRYFEAAKIAMLVAKYINLLGYEARAHVDGNYRVMCVPIATDAGLGELGRLGLLITPKFGPRVRISIVTTNLPLIQDKPVTFGVQHFCSLCKKCAVNCPSSSIDKGDKAIYAGVEKWQSEQESCYRFWRTQGTDCAVCIKVCPYSYPSTLMHNMIRWLVQRNNFARRIAFWGDEFFYGRRPKWNSSVPEWHNNQS